MHKPPLGYKVYRTKLGKFFWVSGNEDPPANMKGWIEVKYKGEFAEVKEASRETYRKKREAQKADEIQT